MGACMMLEGSGTVAKPTRRRRVAAGVVVFVAAAACVFIYIRHTRLHVSTDDAYVSGRVHTVAPRVPGTVTGVYVEDNQLVGPGELLVEIDPADYEVRMLEAASAVDVERSRLSEYLARSQAAARQLEEARARIEAAQAGLALSEANFRLSESDLKRARGLFEKGVVAEASYEKALTAFDVADAQRKAAREQLKQAEASLETQKKTLEQAEEAVKTQRNVLEQKEKTLKLQRLALSYTKIHAPAKGYVTRKNVEVGNQVSANQPLMAVVGLDDVWIVANYKETQLTRVKPGQKVSVKVDTYPGKVFKGRVDSIMAGTGSVFSLFPPESATGNFDKVVQRIPVKIVLEKGSDPDHVLRVGMSVVPTIEVGR